MRQVLPYADLMSQLDIASLRDLEDLLITDCLYAGLLKGRLDQQHRCFQVGIARRIAGWVKFKK